MKRDEQNCNDAMDDLSDLHASDIRQVEREQQEIAGNRYCHARAKSEPEDQLLTGIKAPRCRVLRGDEAPALPQPNDVHLARDIVSHPHGADEYKPSNEREAHEVMNVFGRFGKGAESVGSDERQQHDFSEGDIQAGQGEQDERYCRQPMRKALERVEAPHLGSGRPAEIRSRPMKKYAAAKMTTIPRITTAHRATFSRCLCLAH